jgi:exosortase D (VPLPA-CTERM-specific)
MAVEPMDFIPEGRTVWRLSFGVLALEALVGLLSALPFWNGLHTMWNVWLISPEYSHAILIPLIAGFLVWQQKDRLELTPFDGSWWGVFWVAVGAVLLLLGELGTVYVLVQYAFVITLFGLTLAFLGTAAFRLIAIPMLILFLMIPLPQFVIATLSANLQLLSSQVGVWFIRLFGISVFLEGNVIDLGGYKLQVAEACSGLNYLFPLMTIGFLMAYFYKGALWKRASLFFSSIPIAVIMNSLRIGTIGVMVEHWGIATAEGFLHEFQGWAVFMASALLMVGEMMLFNRIGHEAGTWRQLFGVEFPASSPQDARRKRRTVPRSFLVACTMLIVMAVTALIPRPVDVTPPRSTFSQFPMTLGGWTGHPNSLDGIYLDVLQLSDYLLADYVNDAGPPVNLYVAYYESQRKGEAVHSPRSCLPGGGWQLRDFNQRTLSNVKIGGRPLRVNRTLIELGDQRQLVYYWFQQRGRIVTNEFAVKWYLFWDALTRHRTDGALVRLIVTLPATGNEAEADRRLADLANQVAPILTRYVPD